VRRGQEGAGWSGGDPAVLGTGHAQKTLRLAGKRVGEKAVGRGGVGGQPGHSSSMGSVKIKTGMAMRGMFKHSGVIWLSG